jgi:peptidoglycan/xylan/chitin deacetylase (PgdA/CDA1 family)
LVFGGNSALGPRTGTADVNDVVFAAGADGDGVAPDGARPTEHGLSRRSLVFGAAAASVLAACGRRTETTPASPDTVAEMPMAGPADATGVAIREARVQVSPLALAPVRPFFAGELIRAVKTTSPFVMLTFDDGPDSVHTLAIANCLRRRGYDGKATFFQIANNALVYPHITRELFARGYEIANHTKTHSNYTGAAQAREMGPAQDILESVTGTRPRFFRSAGLTLSQAIQDECARQDIPNVFTDNDERDWISPRVSAEQMNASFARYLHPGYISLRHDGGTHRNTLDAMDGLLDVIEANGYEVVSLMEGLSRRTDLVDSRHAMPERYVETLPPSPPLSTCCSEGTYEPDV